MSKKIIIIDNSSLSYSGEDINGTFLRGTETSLILLAEQFYKMGHKIDYCNEIKDNRIFNGVRYFNKKNIDKKITYDLAIAISDANQFNHVTSLKKAVFSVSNQAFEKFLRKKQLISFLKYKPKVICFSNYHYNSRSFLTSFFGKEIITPSIDNDFYTTKLPLKNHNDVIFYSRADRNGQLILDIWKDLFINNSIKSKFFIPKDLFIENEEMVKFNIVKKEFLPKNELINFLKNFRILIIPGHKGEVFCNVAEEAKALGIPIITLGIGALKERVKNNYNGFLCHNLEDFKSKIFQLLKDDDLYQRFKNNLLRDRGENKWSNTVNSLINLF